MARSDLEAHFLRIDKLASEMNSFVPDGTHGSIDFRADLAGLLVVAIASTYETCVKEILVRYAAGKNPDFEQFVFNHFSKLNSKISENDLNSYTKVFGSNIHAKFGSVLKRRKKRIQDRLGKNICTYYKQILSWRHEYAHAGVRNTTISEALEFHLYAKRVILCFDEAFR
jgi:hypothetical protein